MATNRTCLLDRCMSALKNEFECDFASNAHTRTPPTRSGIALNEKTRLDQRTNKRTTANHPTMFRIPTPDPNHDIEIPFDSICDATAPVSDTNTVSTDTNIDSDIDTVIDDELLDRIAHPNLDDDWDDLIDVPMEEMPHSVSAEIDTDPETDPDLDVDESVPHSHPQNKVQHVYKQIYPMQSAATAANPPAPEPIHSRHPRLPSNLPPHVREKLEKLRQNPEQHRPIVIPRPVFTSPCPEIQGIPNIGNSCYLNTILQLCIHIGLPRTPIPASTIEACTVHRTRRSLQLWNEWCLFAEQYHAAVHGVSASDASPSSISPRRFLTFLVAMTRERGLDMFEHHTQSDACELYMFLIDEFVLVHHYLETMHNPQLVQEEIGMIDGLLGNYRAELQRTMDANAYTGHVDMMLTAAREAEVRIAERETCSLWKHFYGFVISCYESRNTPTPPEMVKLEISPHATLDVYLSSGPNGTGNTTLVHELNRMLQWENMDDELLFTIEHRPDKPRVNARKLTRYWKAPELMVVSLHRPMTQLHRQSHRVPGKTGHLDVPEELLLDSLMFVSPHTIRMPPAATKTDPACPHDRIPHHYQLVATCNHYGTAHSGHYNACIFKNNEWYMCNDEHISKLSWEDMHTHVLSRYAKLLFYQRVSAPAPK